MVTGFAITDARLGRIVEEAASEVYIFAAPDFRFRLVNKGARDNLGFTIEELKGLTPWDIKPEFSREAFLDMARPLAEGLTQRLDFETVHQRRDGSVYNVSVKLQIFDDGEEAVYYAAIQDVTSHKSAVRSLRETTNRLDAILANTVMSIFLMDENQHCVFMNRAAEDLTGYGFAEVTGRPLHDVIHHTRPDGSPFPLAECPIDRAFPENAGTRGEEVFVRKDGSFVPVSFTASPVRNEQAQIVGTIIEVRDISADKRSEEARNLLMREVDHRARNALAVVQSLSMLSRAEDISTYRKVLTGRISALARAHASLANRKWEGGRLEDVVRDELSALCPGEQVDLAGPDVTLTPDQVQPLSMLVHELATNANKYGALSAAGGRVAVSWTREDAGVKLRWQETGGPPVVAPVREGFGTTLKAGVVRQIKGTLTRRWDPTGLVVDIEFPA